MKTSNKKPGGVTKFLRIATIGYAITCLTIGCKSHSPENTASVQEVNADSTRQDKTQVYVDTAEVSTYRQNEEGLIRENDERIAKLKEKIRKEKNAMANEYNTQLDTLHQENSRMETRLKEFSKKSKTDWESFKYDFNRDMDSLGKSISGFAERNMSSNNNQKQ